MNLTLTDILALIGTIGSTIAITWNIFRDIGEKKLIVHAFIGKIIPDYKDQDYLVITVTNAGRRSVLVEKCGGYYIKDDGQKQLFLYPLTKKLPKMLSEGEYVIETISNLDVLNKSLRQLCVWDSTGKEWSVPKKKILEIISQMQTKLNGK